MNLNKHSLNGNNVLNFYRQSFSQLTVRIFKVRHLLLLVLLKTKLAKLMNHPKYYHTDLEVKIRISRLDMNNNRFFYDTQQYHQS